MGLLACCGPGPELNVLMIDVDEIDILRVLKRANLIIKECS